MKVINNIQSYRSGSICIRGNEYYILIFSFLSVYVKAKRGFEFRHSIRNALKFWRKVENEMFFNTKLSLPILLFYAGYRMKLKKKEILVVLFICKRISMLLT